MELPAGREGRRERERERERGENEKEGARIERDKQGRFLLRSYEVWWSFLWLSTRGDGNLGFVCLELSRFCRREDGVVRLLVGVCVFVELGFGASLLSLSQRRGDRHTQDTQNESDCCCISCIHKRTPC